MSSAPSSAPSVTTTMAPDPVDPKGATATEEQEDAEPQSTMTVAVLAAAGSTALAAALACAVRRKRQLKRRRSQRQWVTPPAPLAIVPSACLANIELVPMAKVVRRAPGPPSPVADSRVRIVHAIYDYAAKHVDELSFRAGEILTLTLMDASDGGSNQDEKPLDVGWARGRNDAGVGGLVPLNYVAGGGNPPPAAARGAGQQAEQDDDAFVVKVEPDDSSYGGGGGGGGGGWPSLRRATIAAENAAAEMEAAAVAEERKAAEVEKAAAAAATDTR